MGVAVLHPQSHFIADPLFPRKRSPSKPHGKPPTKTKPNSNRGHQSRRKKSPAKSLATSPPPAPPAKNLVMGRVRLLKRGEEIAVPATALEPKVETEAKRNEGGAGSASPAHELAQPRTQKAELARFSAGSDRVLAGFYAGSAFITSPPPSSVPMPAFFTKKTGGLEGFADPTSDLRRLLRLD